MELAVGDWDCLPTAVQAVGEWQPVAEVSKAELVADCVGQVVVFGYPRCLGADLALGLGFSTRR